MTKYGAYRWHQEPRIFLTLTHQSRPFGYTSCLTSYKSSGLNYHWIHISSAWPQIYQGKALTKASLESVDLPVVQPILPSSFSLSSRKMWRWLREMVELGFRSLHNEEKEEKGSGKRMRERTTRPQELQLLCFQKQWAVREQWPQTKSWSIYICHCGSQTGGIGNLPSRHSSNGLGRRWSHQQCCLLTNRLLFGSHSFFLA